MMVTKANNIIVPEQTQSSELTFNTVMALKYIMDSVLQAEKRVSPYEINLKNSRIISRSDFKLILNIYNYGILKFHLPSIEQLSPLIDEIIRATKEKKSEIHISRTELSILNCAIQCILSVEKHLFYLHLLYVCTQRMGIISGQHAVKRLKVAFKKSFLDTASFLRVTNMLSRSHIILEDADRLLERDWLWHDSKVILLELKRMSYLARLTENALCNEFSSLVTVGSFAYLMPKPKRPAGCSDIRLSRALHIREVMQLTREVFISIVKAINFFELKINAECSFWASSMFNVSLGTEDMERTFEDVNDVIRSRCNSKYEIEGASFLLVLTTHFK